MAANRPAITNFSWWQDDQASPLHDWDSHDPLLNLQFEVCRSDMRHNGFVDEIDEFNNRLLVNLSCFRTIDDLNLLVGDWFLALGLTDSRRQRLMLSVLYSVSQLARHDFHGAGSVDYAFPDRTWLLRIQRIASFPDIAITIFLLLMIRGTPEVEEHDAFTLATTESVVVSTIKLPFPADELSIEALEKVPSPKCCNELCMVCLVELSSEVEVICMPCSHLFHRNCIVQWLRTSCVCPLCRNPLPSCD